MQYPRGLRVVVFTANAIYPDCNNKSEGLWTQDFPVKDSESPAVGWSSPTCAGLMGNCRSSFPHPPSCMQSSLFEDELVAYVDQLRLPPTVSAATRAIIRLHDFSAARARLVGSVPGRHAGGWPGLPQGWRALCLPACQGLQILVVEDTTAPGTRCTQALPWRRGARRSCALRSPRRPSRRPLRRRPSWRSSPLWGR